MARKTVRVAMPTNKPDKFIELMKRVVEKHEELGASSPFNSASWIDMAGFKAKLLQADALREESIEHRETAEAKMMQAKVILGISEGQTSFTEGTLYYELVGIKRFLQSKYQGSELDMAPFGFHVVIDTAKGIGRPKKKKS